MERGKADTLDDQQFKKLLKQIAQNSHRPVVDKAAFLLSYKAGLRVREIAGLEWKKHVIDVDGKLKTQEFHVPGSRGRMKRIRKPVLTISKDIGKYGSDRVLPMNPLLEEALQELIEEKLGGEWVIPSAYASKQELYSRSSALKVRVNRFYKALGYENCSSHSGRRTFITNAARNANTVQASIVDVQKMAGHKQLTTTQGYVDVSDSQALLIDMI